VPVHSLVIPIYVPTAKHIAMTRKCIDLARKNTKIQFETVIVETGSDYFKDDADIHIYEKERSCVTKSTNRGLKVASGEYITFLTNDVFVSEGWIESLLACFKERGDCGASTLASTQFNHQAENKIEEGNWYSVAMSPKKIYEEIGYMDEGFPGVFDDTDWILRLYKAGYKMYRNHACVVEHLIGATHYIDEKHKRNFETARELYNKKHEGCELPFFLQTR
jgi:glycosyltransferase involved in cell wall biosynthesis